MFRINGGEHAGAAHGGGTRRSAQALGRHAQLRSPGAPAVRVAAAAREHGGRARRTRTLRPTGEATCLTHLVNFSTVQYSTYVMYLYIVPYSTWLLYCIVHGYCTL